MRRRYVRLVESGKSGGKTRDEVARPSKEDRPSRGRGGESGQALVLAPLILTALLAASAIVIDMGNLYWSYQELRVNTQAAARAGGQAMVNPAVSSVNDEVNLYSGATAKDYNYHPNLTTLGPIAVNIKYGCISSSTYPGLNLPPCSSSPTNSYTCPNGVTGCNALQVTETTKVPTFFARFFGVSSLNISASAAASVSGAGAIPYHIMAVLDTTSSMGSGNDTGCLAGSSTSYSPEQCAQYGIQTLLAELAPCNSPSGTSTTGGCGSYQPVAQVGLMVFPGLCSASGSGVTTANCPDATTLTNTTANPNYAPDDYKCPSKNPPIASYNNNPEYLILGLQSNYRLASSGALNSSSALFEAVGAGTNNCGVSTPGGEGTFYAGAITAAQTYLTANHTSGVQDVMILLSDGNASATSTQMAGSVKQNVITGGMTSNNLYSSTGECTQAVSAANYAKGAKQSDGTSTLIYSISYGSELTGCTSGENPNYSTPCQTMAGISSLPLSTYFFSVPQTVKGVQSTICNGAVPITQLSQVFTTIAGTLQASRLIPPNLF